MKFTKAIGIASLVAALIHSPAFAEPKAGEPCHQSGDMAQVGAGAGAKVFTCLDSKWSHTNTIGEKQFQITADLSDGQKLVFIARAGETARSNSSIDQIYVDLATNADGKDSPVSVPYSTGMAFSMTPTMSQSGDIALKINASVSEAVSVDEYAFGDIKVRSPEIHTHRLSRTLKLRDGKSDVVPLGSLKMTLIVVGI